MLGDGKSLRRHLNMYRDMSDARVEVIQRRLQGSPSKELGSRGDGIGDEGSSESQAPGAADVLLETSVASRSKQARNNAKK